jgi:hypothetical protein
MSSRFACSLTILMFGLTLFTFLGARAHADNIEPNFEDQKSSIDKDGNLRLELAASLNAPAAKVYEALTNPDKLAKYSAEVKNVNVNTRSKVHQRAEVKIHQLEGGAGLMVLLLAGGARGGSPPRCCEDLVS